MYLKVLGTPIYCALLVDLTLLVKSGLIPSIEDHISGGLIVTSSGHCAAAAWRVRFVVVKFKSLPPTRFLSVFFLLLYICCPLYCKLCFCSVLMYGVLSSVGSVINSGF